MITAGAPPVADAPVRCGIDTVEIARIERLLAQTPDTELPKLFSAREIDDAGDGPGRAASLAARYAAKEACAKLFPRALAAGRMTPASISTGAPGSDTGASRSSTSLAASNRFPPQTASSG